MLSFINICLIILRLSIKYTQVKVIARSLPKAGITVHYDIKKDPELKCGQGF